MLAAREGRGPWQLLWRGWWLWGRQGVVSHLCPLPVPGQPGLPSGVPSPTHHSETLVQILMAPSFLASLNISVHIYRMTIMIDTSLGCWWDWMRP